MAHEIDPEGLPYLPQNLPPKADIGPDAFFAVDMRAGRVVEVEELPGARKPSWRIGVDFGPAVGTLRTSAQVKNYSREDLMGRLVVGALNLGPKRIAGFESQFLILGALDPDGTVRLLRLDEGVEPGAPIA